MQDFVPLGTGNSRNLKSAIPAGTTWEQALAMLRGGTFPIDIGAVNPSGISQQGNPLNKNTLLKDETAALFGKSNTAVPDEIFQILSNAVLSLSGNFKLPNGDFTSLVNFEIGSYVGNGKNGSGNKNSISFSRKPILVFLLNTYSGFEGLSFCWIPYSTSEITICTNPTEGGNMIAYFIGSKMYYYASTPAYQMNYNNSKVIYVALTE